MFFFSIFKKARYYVVLWVFIFMLLFSKCAQINYFPRCNLLISENKVKKSE
ncbi:hypothetical protein GLOIN_2v1582344 [Rhizophagus irregularis DAOM 181602=DAOM 197198]|uniref:Uncharacterized protein n=1 Tax=Rhizophagus irregularis (strain DAOM 181602 / DAOM 197198 / MUCL 43194) TaxID=747089 RepID=A0A2P4Q7Y6_RHIID|nr:hypothetical protein GLOIN_2v1582344 [Rhizophagus irregularis DAOM 181602=DAOM 197198]POG73746.1 hypothetical protein GLOIN_2v1582344 [Rhizophagus irregularis DAOM 181602=DAOM 197198]GET62237.1 hypothetical protein GLOIN_2v1582344 [Rhizophagus irregularis DAOM 181602=DAOM 197198]|eukprot:XP_025180612.1 hypothetical protein GLOIN_2v1582344 [Rhizophagus irregularis DAOM 181602=DAOM 197198]